MSGQRGKVAPRPGLLGALNMAHAERRNWMVQPHMACYKQWVAEESINWDDSFREILCNCLRIRWFCFQKNQLFRAYDFYRTVPAHLSAPWRPVNAMPFWVGIGCFICVALIGTALDNDRWTEGSAVSLAFLAPYYPVDIHFGLFRGCRSVSAAANFTVPGGGLASVDVPPGNITLGTIQALGTARQENGCFPLHHARGLCAQFDLDQGGVMCLRLEGAKRLECAAVHRLCVTYGPNIILGLELAQWFMFTSGAFSLALAFEWTGMHVRQQKFCGDAALYRKFRIRHLAVYMIINRCCIVVGAASMLIAFLSWAQVGVEVTKQARLQGCEAGPGAARGLGCPATGAVVKQAEVCVVICWIAFYFATFQTSDFLRADRDQVRAAQLRAAGADYMQSVLHFKEEAEKKIDAAVNAELRLIAMVETNMALSRALKVDTSTMDEFKEAFDRIDDDGSGVIDTDETQLFLEEVLGKDKVTPTVVDEFLRKFDDDGDHCIDWEEFQQGIEELRKESRNLTRRLTKAHQTVREFKRNAKRGSMMRMLKVDTLEISDFQNAFNAIDEDGSGVIDSREVTRMMEDMLCAPPPKSAIRNFIKEFDRDGDGEISWDEFETGIVQMKEDFDAMEDGEVQETAIDNGDSDGEDDGDDGGDGGGGAKRDATGADRGALDEAAAAAAAAAARRPKKVFQDGILVPRAECAIDGRQAEEDFEAPAALDARLEAQPAHWHLPEKVALMLDLYHVNVVDVDHCKGVALNAQTVLTGEAAIADTWAWRSGTPGDSEDDPLPRIISWSANAAGNRFTIKLVEGHKIVGHIGAIIEATFACSNAHTLTKEFERCSLSWAHPEKRRTTRATFERKTVRRPSAFELGQIMLAEEEAQEARDSKKKKKKKKANGKKKKVGRVKGGGVQNPTLVRKKGELESAVTSRRLMV